MAMELWTSPTPNGWKVTIMLEELKEAGVALPEGQACTRRPDAKKATVFRGLYRGQPQPENSGFARWRHNHHGKLRHWRVARSGLRRLALE